jgi:hypothetical protein
MYAEYAPVISVDAGNTESIQWKILFFPSRLIQVCWSFKSHHHTSSICASLALFWSLFHLISCIVWFYLHTYCQALETNYHYCCFCIISLCINPSIHQSIHPSTLQSTHLPACPLSYIPTHMSTHPSTNLHNHSPIYQSSLAPTHPPT